MSSLRFTSVHFAREKIWNMDETSIYLDFPSSYTYDEQGTKRIPAGTTGNERARLSAAFTASASGQKLPIFVIIPRATPLPDLTPPANVRVAYSTKATFNQHVLVEEYLPNIIKKLFNLSIP